MADQKPTKPTPRPLILSEQVRKIMRDPDITDAEAGCASLGEKQEAGRGR